MIIVVDVEADGPVPGIFSMIEFGAVAIDHGAIVSKLTRHLKPIGERFQSEALKAIGVSREETLKYRDAEEGIKDLDFWLSETVKSPDRPIFFSDNNGFDWQFINYYMWTFLNRNPFGFSSNNISNIYGGVTHRTRNYGWKNYRVTKHTHGALDDAMGNAEALLTIANINHIELA